MKAIHGLIIAIFLGIAAALFNFAYLNRRARDVVETVDFIAVKPKVTINRGDKLSDNKLTRVSIPKASIGNLDKLAYRYKSLPTVIGEPVWRTLPESSLLLRDDLRTPPQQLELEEGERAMFIPVDNRAFVPSLLVPGDKVTFLVAKLQSAPTPAMPSGGAGGAPLIPPPGLRNPMGTIDRIGPFTVLAIGNRLGSANVLDAYGGRQTQENVLTISVKEKNGRLEPQAEKLWNVLQATDFRSVGILLHDREGRKK